MEFLQGISIQLIQALQTLSPVLDGLSNFLGSLGSLGFFILLIPLIYWTVDTRLGKTAWMALIISAFVSLSLNQLLHQPRPYWLGDVQPLISDGTYGNPSTQAACSIAVFGYLAYRLKKEWIWAASGLTVLLVGIARLYQGVEFPSGVIAGWVIGLGVVSLLVKLDSISLLWWDNQPASRQVGIVFICSILVILAGYAVGAIIAPSPDPIAWAGFATTARSLSGYYVIAGGLFGAISGHILMKKHLEYKTTGSLIMRIGRCLVGFAGLGMIYFGLGAVIDSLVFPETIRAFTLQYIQLSLLTFWVMFLAPWLFMKLSLVKRVMPAPV
jgi:membrane-associated phospholipid phosphatase